MKHALIFGVLLLAGSAVPSRTDTGSNTLVSKYGHFSVRMPGQVQEQTVSSREEGGTVWQYLYTVNNGAPNSFGVSCWDYTNAPNRSLASDELDSSVEVQRESLLPGKFSVKKIRLGSVPGRELRIVHPDGNTDLFRFYLKGRRLYSISAQTDGRAHLKEASREFLDSFRLLP